MEYFKALKSIAKDQGVKVTDIGPKAGRSRTYVSACVTNACIPSLSVGNELAAPLGYRLALIPTDTPADALDAIGAIPLDAARREQ